MSSAMMYKLIYLFETVNKLREAYSLLYSSGDYLSSKMEYLTFAKLDYKYILFLFALLDPYRSRVNSYEEVRLGSPLSLQLYTCIPLARIYLIG